ncbi:MAG: ferritin-like domain-containing protein [Gammaproteobacteria bacterium]|jgi:bacterioferritin
MLAARSDQKVLGYLGRALSLELSAVQQYSTQARLAASWGLSEAAASFRKEAGEELQHADRIIDRMLAVGVAPAASQLRPVELAADLSGLLRLNQQFEADVIGLYQSATRHAASVGDHDSRVFFEELLQEEQAHHAELGDWLHRLQQIPDQRRRGTR